MTFATRNLLVGFAALALSAASAQTASAQTTLRATLYGADADPDATGSARFVAHGHVTRLEVDLQGVTYSDDVVVLLDGVPVTEIFLTDGSGFTELEVETRGGVVYYQPPIGTPIPIEAGTEIDIVDPSDGTVLLIGNFG